MKLINKKLNNLLEMVIFLRDNSVTKDEFNELKTDVGVLKADVNVLKTDVGVLKADVGILKIDVDVLKTDVSNLKSNFSIMLNSLDSLTKKTEDYHLEYLSLTQKVGRHHQWINKASNKLNIQIEY